MHKLLHKAIESLATNKPELLKSRQATKTFLLDICWRAIKKNKIKKQHWDDYFNLINILLEEFCVEAV